MTSVFRILVLLTNILSQWMSELIDCRNDIFEIGWYQKIMFSINNNNITINGTFYYLFEYILITYQKI